MVRTVSVYTADAEGSYNGKSWNAPASRRCWSVLCKIFFKIHLADVSDIIDRCINSGQPEGRTSSENLDLAFDSGIFYSGCLCENLF